MPEHHAGRFRVTGIFKSPPPSPQMHWPYIRGWFFAWSSTSNLDGGSKGQYKRVYQVFTLRWRAARLDGKTARCASELTLSLFVLGTAYLCIFPIVSPRCAQRPSLFPFCFVNRWPRKLAPLAIPMLASERTPRKKYDQRFLPSSSTGAPSGSLPRSSSSTPRFL